MNTPVIPPVFVIAFSGHRPKEGIAGRSSADLPTRRKPSIYLTSNSFQQVISHAEQALLNKRLEFDLAQKIGFEH